MEEIWKDIEGYEGLYQVSNLGRVKSLERIYKNRKSFSITNKGYYRMPLYKNGKQKCHHIHKLVAKAFILNPENKPTVDHIDRNKQNNCVDNLRWATYKEQIANRVLN